MKIMWVKFGWSEFYRGGVVDGNFGWLNDGRGGHAPYNFLPGPNGEYYCYVPPQGRAGSAPYSKDPYGWTVVCLAKFPAQKGIHVVGWYEDAELMGEWLPQPEYKASGGFPLDDQGNNFTYSIKSKNVFFVPPEYRSNPFSHLSVRTSKYSYLSGPDVDQTLEKRSVENFNTRVVTP